MGLDASEMAVRDWNWRQHTSRTSGKDMLAVTYYGDLSDAPVTEYLPVAHDGYAGQKALNLLATICANAGIQLQPDSTLPETAAALNGAIKPALIKYHRDGKFHRVTAREW
jgi:DNA repair protein RadD